jgi:hypothetical protein
MEQQRYRHRRGAAPPTQSTNRKRVGQRVVVVCALVLVYGGISTAVVPSIDITTALVVALLGAVSTIGAIFAASMIFRAAVVNGHTEERAIHRAQLELERAELDNDTARRNERLRDGHRLVGIQGDAPPGGRPRVIRPREELNVVVKVDVHLPD